MGLEYPHVDDYVIIEASEVECSVDEDDNKLVAFEMTVCDENQLNCEYIQLREDGDVLWSQ